MAHGSSIPNFLLINPLKKWIIVLFFIIREHSLFSSMFRTPRHIGLVLWVPFTYIKIIAYSLDQIIKAFRRLYSLILFAVDTVILSLLISINPVARYLTGKKELINEEARDVLRSNSMILSLCCYRSYHHAYLLFLKLYDVSITLQATAHLIIWLQSMQSQELY